MVLLDLSEKLKQRGHVYLQSMLSKHGIHIRKANVDFECIILCVVRELFTFEMIKTTRW